MGGRARRKAAVRDTLAPQIAVMAPPWWASLGDQPYANTGQARVGTSSRITVPAILKKNICSCQECWFRTWFGQLLQAICGALKVANNTQTRINPIANQRYLKSRLGLRKGVRGAGGSGTTGFVGFGRTGLVSPAERVALVPTGFGCRSA